jgi:hypothetical protein
VPHPGGAFGWNEPAREAVIEKLGEERRIPRDDVDRDVERRALAGDGRRLMIAENDGHEVAVTTEQELFDDA